MTQQNSANLSLPYIQPAQAQKHVTHNEAIRVLDALVQPTIKEGPRNTPPTTVADGARYIVGETPTDDWLDHANEIAWRTDGAWSFLAPKAGWSIRTETDGLVHYWLDGAWQVDGVAAAAPKLGINTTADSINRLSVSSQATLLTHDGSDHQVKINKNTEFDTASLLFQTGFSGRAEMGTAGDDAFSIKVSADGMTWNSALTIDPATGTAQFPSGARMLQTLDVGGRWHCYSDNRWVTFPPEFGGRQPVNNESAGTGAEPALSWKQMGPPVSAGSTIKRVAGLVRAGDPSITGYDLRIVFQHGPMDGGWNNNEACQRDVLLSLTGETLADGFNRLSENLGNYVAPADGTLVVFFRPVGTLASTEFLYTALTVELETTL